MEAGGTPAAGEPHAPSLPEIAGEPFDDVLQALDPTAGLTCEDDSYEDESTQEIAP